MVIFTEDETAKWLFDILIKIQVVIEYMKALDHKSSCGQNINLKRNNLLLKSISYFLISSFQFPTY